MPPEYNNMEKDDMYSLGVILYIIIFGKPPFKNLIVNGLVLASDGQKMSKKKKNYPDPSLVIE